MLEHAGWDTVPRRLGFTEAFYARFTPAPTGAGLGGPIVLVGPLADGDAERKIQCSSRSIDWTVS